MEGGSAKIAIYQQCVFIYPLSKAYSKIGRRKCFPFIGAVVIVMLVPAVGVLADVSQPGITSGDQFPEINEFVALDKMSELIYKEPPVYPRLAQRAGIQGKVYGKALIDKDGLVREAVVIKSSESALLDKSARAAALKNKYKPGMFKGKPVACWVPFKVEFVMEGKG